MGKDEAGRMRMGDQPGDRKGSAGQAEPEQQQDDGQGGRGLMFWGLAAPALGTDSAEGAELVCCRAVLAGPLGQSCGQPLDSSWLREEGSIFSSVKKAKQLQVADWEPVCVPVHSLHGEGTGLWAGWGGARGDLGGDELLQVQKGEHCRRRHSDPGDRGTGTSVFGSLCPILPRGICLCRAEEHRRAGVQPWRVPPTLKHVFSHRACLQLWSCPAAPPALQACTEPGGTLRPFGSQPQCRRFLCSAAV